jgi:signal transduction histidine kinase
MSSNYGLTAEAIRQQHNELAEKFVNDQYERQPGVWKPLGAPGLSKSVRDAGYHLTYLAEALAAGDPTLTIDYLAWVKVLFAGLKFRENVLPETIECTRRALKEALSPHLAAPALEFLEMGLKGYIQAPILLASFIEVDNPTADLARNQLIASRKNISIRLETAPISLALLDLAKIEQVVDNLVTNAIKYSPPGSLVTIRLQPAEGGCLLSVQDQGTGIPVDELDRLFKPFQRTSVKSTGGEKSTGLGMVIVKRIVEGHGGRIWVESQVGSGSTFCVFIPSGANKPD